MNLRIPAEQQSGDSCWSDRHKSVGLLPGKGTKFVRSLKVITDKQRGNGSVPPFDLRQRSSEVIRPEVRRDGCQKALLQWKQKLVTDVEPKQIDPLVACFDRFIRPAERLRDGLQLLDWLRFCDVPAACLPATVANDILDTFQATGDGQ